MQSDVPSANRPQLPPLKIASRVGVVLGIIVFIGLLLLLLFPGPLVNIFIKPRVTKALAKAYPAYSVHIGAMSYSVFTNRMRFDSVAVGTISGAFSSNLSSVSVSRMDWMHLLWKGSPATGDLAGSVMDAQNIVLNIPKSHYELRCERLHISVADSEIVVEAAKLHPSHDDEEFFAGSIFRRNRYSLIVPYARVLGVACIELLKGKNYRARSVQIRDAFLDVLTNMDKLPVNDNSSPPMPNEILSSIKGTLQIDSLSIANGRLHYGERYTIDSMPALVTFDSVQVLAKGIANHGDRGADIVIHAEGTFMKAGTMTLLMTFPVASPEFSFQYSGSLSSMDIGALNSYTEPADQIRIKTGVLQSASFEINVVSGRASGSVRAVYKDLNLAVISKHTGSAKGLFRGISSSYINIVKVRGTNMPDNSGSMKMGEVKYVRKRNDPFFAFAWFALFSGIQDAMVH